MRRLVLASFVALLSLTALEAQAADWYDNKPITDIRFEGLQRIRYNDLKGLIQPYIGKPFTVDLLNALQRSLFSLDYFDGLQPDLIPWDAGKTSVVVVFTVIERPTISQIEVTGNTLQRTVDVLGSVKSKSGDSVNKSKFADDVKEIKKFYKEKGFSAAEVSFDILDVPNRPNSRKLVFKVVEGKQTTVKAIKFSGNSFASEGTLKGLLKTKEQALFQPGAFIEENIPADKETILKYYKEQGFPDVVIHDVQKDVTWDEKDKRDNLIITFILEEGMQWKFGGFNLIGNTLFTTDELLKRTKAKVGTTLNLTQIQADFQSIADVYYQRGYAFNGWDMKDVRDPETKLIKYNVTVTERGIAYIGDIQIRGNVKTKKEIIDRELPFKVGDIFSTDRIKQGYYNLMNTKYFSSVDPEPSVMDNGLVQIIITVEEQSTVDLRVGGSLSGDTDFPLAFLANWSDSNLGGNGRTLGINTTLSGKEQSVKTTLSDGWLFGESFGGSATLGLSRARTSAFYRTIEDGPGWGSNYLATAASGSTTAIYKYYSNWDISLEGLVSKTWRRSYGKITLGGGAGTEFNYVDYNDSEWAPYSSTLRDNKGIFVPINQVNVFTAFDSRDISFDPSSGFYAYQGVTFYGGFLLGGRNYTKTETTLQYWLTLFDVPVFAEWNWKMVFGLNSTMTALWPAYWISDWNGDWCTVTDRLLTINPMILARGWYNWETALGLTGGRAIWNNWAELRTPIIRQALSFDMYFDAVRITDVRQDIKSPGGVGWLFGYGAGLRLAMQGLPLRLYVGKRFMVDNNGTILWQRGSLFANSSNSNATDGVDLILAISLN